jgi:hypothetical protein
MAIQDVRFVMATRLCEDFGWQGAFNFINEGNEGT